MNTPHEDYIHLTQPELVNLAQALGCEFLSTNHSGGYMCTTAALCNTRKYHGLMVLPLEHFGGERHVLLSTLDERLTIHGKPFNLSVRRYPGTYDPRGHKYLEYFTISETPTFIYRVGGVVLKKELLFPHTQEHLLVRYTLLEAESSVQLRVSPFLAFRNAHQLCHANLAADTRCQPIPNGISIRLYPGFPTLHLQTNLASDYVHAPDWYYNIEYPVELARGYDGHEDLMVPGYFELTLRPGTPAIFSVCTHKVEPRRLSAEFNRELQLRPPRVDFRTTLEAAAGQFIADRGRRIEVEAGYPWFGRWGRDTLIALPGLTLTTGEIGTFERALTSLLAEAKDGFLPNMGGAANPAFNSVDAPLWLFATVQAYCTATGEHQRAWELWGKQLRAILEKFLRGTGLPYGIRRDANGLIWAGERGYALTWMDAIVHGEAVTPRIGYPVEINALWYNALCFMREMCERMASRQLLKLLANEPERVAESFCNTFVLPQGYLSDVVDGAGLHTSIRPNQILAVSLPYSPLPQTIQIQVLAICEQDLYTPLGLRTLSPKNPAYHGRYEGSEPERDRAYHQGTIWTWLIAPYVAAVERVRGKEEATRIAHEVLTALEREMHRCGLGTLGEVYDGDPPHTPGGSIAQAWSVAAAMELMGKYM